MPRTIGFCHDLKNEVEDLEQAWAFVQQEKLVSDDEDEEMGNEHKEFKELTAEDMDKANSALQAHMLIIAELKRKIEHELYMAEAAATAGWGAVAVLENKMFDNVSGDTEAEKELKTQRIRKAQETYVKEQKLLGLAGPSKAGTFKSKTRTGRGFAKKFGPWFDGGRKRGGYGGRDPQGMVAAAGGYGGGYGGYGGDDGRSYGAGMKGSGGYGSRGTGGSRGGSKPTRTCHRSVPGS